MTKNVVLVKVVMTKKSMRKHTFTVSKYGAMRVASEVRAQRGPKNGAEIHAFSLVL